MYLTPARLGQRCKAFLWDYLLLSAWVLLMCALGFWLQTRAPERVEQIFSSPEAGQAAGFLLMTLPVSLYFALCESSRAQASWGKRRVGLKVTNSAGAALSFPLALARTLFKFVPWEATHFLIWQARFAEGELPAWFNAGLVLVWAWIAANAVAIRAGARHQALYDRLAGTLVLDVRARAASRA